MHAVIKSNVTGFDQSDYLIYYYNIQFILENNNTNTYAMRKKHKQ